ncbi:hypothetical protein TKK_0015440 [Trichogramma kaykai]
MDRVCVIRKQFPICCSYGITIHKSQGLSQKNAAVEAGNDIFKTGQIYVALSRVTSLNGLHLINFDPSKIKASTSAIIEYNRLKQIFRPDLKQYDGIHDMSWSTCIADNRWIPRDIPFETHLNKKITVTEREVQGLPNDDGYSSCVNVTLQCLFNCEAVRRIFSETKDDFIVKRLFQSYESKEIFNVHNLRLFVNAKYSLRVQCNVAEFLQELVNKQLLLQQIMKHALKCPGCSERIVSENKSNYILELILPIDRRSCSLQEIFHYNVENWIIVPIMCKNSCKCQYLRKYDKITLINSTLIVKLLSYEDACRQQLVKVNQNINQVTKSIIKIQNKQFKVSGAIFHHGKNFPEGYYSNMLRIQKHWIFVKDQCVQKKSWSRSSNNVYIVFLELN